MAISKLENVTQWRTAALRRLSIRDHSFYELKQYLVRRGASKEEAQTVLSALVQEGLLSEKRFIDAMIHYYSKQSKGPLAIVQKLKKKGVEIRVQEVKAALCESGVEEIELACKLVERKYGKWRKDKKTALRAIAALTRRGFSREVITAIINIRDINSEG